MTIDLTSRTALVTGAGSGIGRAVTIALARCNARVVVTDLEEHRAAATSRTIKGNGGNVHTFRLDVTDAEEVKLVANEVLKKFGSVDILVNSAGWEKVESFVDSSLPTWRKNIEVNLLGAALVVHAFLPAMIAAGKGGRIISISSDAGRVGSPGEVMYSAAKAGIAGFSKALARETMKHAVTVNCVSPGPADTPFFHALPERTREMLAKAIPAGRLCRPDEVAAAVLYFASDEAGYVTGQTLSVSGGLTMAG